MSANTIASSLGLLQDDPDHEQAWEDLRQALAFDPSVGTATPPEGSSITDVVDLLGSARRAHEMRREYEAVAELLRLEVALSRGTEPEAALAAELGRVYDDELLDDARAAAAYQRLLELQPDSGPAREALERSEARRTRWRELVARYVEEAKDAGEPAFKSSLLVSAAETAYRFGRPELLDGDAGGKKKKAAKEREKRLQALLEEIVGGLREALELDPKNRRASLLLERVLREMGRYDDVVRALEQFANETAAKDERVAALIRLARVLKRKLQEPARAMAAYERVIDLSPGHAEATRNLVDYFTEKEDWDHLVALYDEQLAGGAVRPGQEVGVILQIAMVHWRMRERPDAAEPYFERMRKAEPAHPGMLSFFREWCAVKGESARLMAILTEAQRVMADGPDRQRVAAEIAQLAEEGANAQKAIEQWRGILRQDPTNKDARSRLKRLYRQTAGWNALADLLRSELERVAPDDAEQRLPVLREIASIYRDHLKSDSALVTVLSQITTLDPRDRDAIRELVRVYDALGRWRDLLTSQMRLAELEEDAGTKAELYRAIARRWLDQFSNVQNAVEAYEKLREASPADAEAVAKLKELYTKRRAYRQLFELHEAEVAALGPGPERRDLYLEMGKLAAERLDRGADAQRLYKKILEEDPSNAVALDLLEKQAERDKDFATVAEVLERRAELSSDDASRLNVLHKLGGIYTDRLQDTAGAMRTWRRVLELSPGHAKAMRVLREGYLAVGDYDGLTALYAQSEDWDGLVEVLSTAADRATDASLKVDLSYRAADVLNDKLRAPERAFRSYERILGVRPDDQRAASALVPIYEKEEKWARLPALYEILLAGTDDPTQKLSLLRKLGDVSGQHLQDRAAAFGYAARVYEIEPDRTRALEEFEAAARVSGEWEKLATALSKRAASADASDAEKRALRVRLAGLSAASLGKIDDAVATYKELVLADPTDASAVSALDSLLRQHDRRDDLRWLFRLRVDRAADASEARIAILSEWAMLEEEALSEPERATALYREILEIDGKHTPALRALARLLHAQGDAQGAAEILERDRDLREGAERVAREIELARLFMGPLRKPLEALAAAQRALEVSPDDPAAIAVIEELLPVAETRAKSAIILEASYATTGQLAKQADVLLVLIATAAAKEDRQRLYLRLCDVYERLGQLPSAFDVLSRAASEFPQELSLWDRLAVLANRTHRTQEFVEALAQTVPAEGESGLPVHVELDLAERAATLYEEMLGEIDRARPYWERILDRDPGNDRAFARLKQILTTRERWQDLEGLYERIVARTEDPTRKTDLLTEAALVAEEITQDEARAVGFHERILEIDPAHEQAALALDKLYASRSEWSKLAKLLAMRIGRSGEGDVTALKVRLGKLYFTELGDPKSALSYLEEVLTADTDELDAKELVEKCLDVPELRARAAVVLEGVYVARDDHRHLVRVLEVRLESTTDPIERRELLRRVAELRDDKLTDDAGAFSAYARLLPLAPADESARARLLEIAKRTSALEKAAEVLTETAKAADAPQPRAEILSDVAGVYESLGESDKAEGVWKEVVALDADDPVLALPAARALERIYAAGGKTRELADALRAQVRLEDNAEARRELQARLGELSEQMLDDLDGAIAAWKARLDDDPADARALAALDRLFVRTNRHAELVEVLRARERAADGPDARRELMTRAGKTLADDLGDVPEAILAYRAVLDDFGAEGEVLRALAKLYAKAERWQDLAETLEAQLGITTDDAERVELTCSLGEVQRARLDDKEGALSAFRETLALAPSHERSRRALEEMLSDEAARRDAAAILRPLYEADGADAALLRVLDIEIESEGGVRERLALLSQAATVAEAKLNDAARAFSYTSAGLAAAAGEDDFGDWLERAERLVAASGAYEPYVRLLERVAPDVLDEERQLGVLLRTGELARDRLGDRELSKAKYKKALELRADDERALVALEGLHEALGEHADLLEILKRRAEVAASDDDKRVILFKQARLSEEELGDKEGAITVYEEILEGAFDPEAASALERLYGELGRFNDLIAVYERELGLDTVGVARRAELYFKLGEVWRTKAGDTERAFEQYEGALRTDAQHEPTIAALEQLMGERDHAARAAEMLEGVYLARLDWRKVMRAVEARLDASQDPEERRQLLRRLAKLREEQEEDYRAALEVTGKLLAEDLTDESTWAELERLARVAAAEARLAEIYATELEKQSSDEPATARLALRTGELFEAEKNDERALVFYRRAYAFSPEESPQAFAAIDRLLVRGGRHADRVALYRDSLDFKTSPEDRLATLHAIAALEEKELADDEAAIATYRSALDVDESDGKTLDSLTRLFERRGRHQDLADLTRKRAEQSALPEDEARFRLDLGKLLEGKLGDVPGAIDEYQRVVELDPVGGVGQAAIGALERLVAVPEHRARIVDILRPIYEGADDWRKLIVVNEERLRIANDVSDRVQILRETALLWEERGKDVERAFACVKQAFELDPEDGESREQLDRLAVATSRWDDLAAAYETGIAKIDGIGQRELLEALARLHDKRRDDPRHALDAWERLFKLDETDIRPLEEMDQLATLLSDWPSLVRVLAKKAELLSADDERASTWRRIGEARRDMLEDMPGAVDAYERALELEPDSAFTLDNLIPLYEAKNDAARLVDLYKRRIELCGEDDEGLKFQLLSDAAQRYEVGLGDRREAIQLLSDALAVRPGDADVVRRLGELYTQEKLWPELLENLRLQAAQTAGEDERRNLKRRIGDLLSGELEEPAQALDAYREVLAGGYDDHTVKAVRALAESREEIRVEAADILEPVLRGARQHELVVDVLELRLRAESEPEPRTRTLRAIAALQETELSSPKEALAALLRALSEVPHDAEVHAEIERVARVLGKAGYEQYADALAEKAASVFEAATTADLYMRLGRVAQAELSDLPRAAEAFQSAAERGGDSLEVLSALEGVYGGLGDTRALVDVLERRIGLAEGAGEQAELHHRLAVLQIDKLGEKAQGLGTLRVALEKVPDHAACRATLERLLDDPSLFDEVFDILESVYRQLAMGEAIAGLFERKVAKAERAEDRVRARLDLARVLEKDVSDPTRAQHAVEAALLDEPANPDVLAELERLAATHGTFASAQQALAKALDQHEQAAASMSSPNLAQAAEGTATELWVRLAEWRRDRLDDARGAEDAFLRAQKGAPDNLDVVRAIEMLQRAPGRERDLVATLRSRAKLETDLETKREVFREAKALADAPVADPALSEAVLRDLLAEDEADLWALEELTKLRDAQGDAAQVAKLLLRRAELSVDGGDILRLKHEAARVFEEKLGDTERAIALYQEILEQEPSDADAGARLRAAFEKLGRFQDLVRLLQRQIEIAESPGDRAALRIVVARTQFERFKATQDAIDVLRAILDEDGGHEEAILLLSRILEESGQDAELAELLNSQIDRARDAGDTSRELTLQVRLGELLESRVKDTGRALATFEAVLERDPSHRGALEAVARLAEARDAWDRSASALDALVSISSGADVVTFALRLAGAREKLGDADGVEDALGRALAVDVRDENVRGRLRALFEKRKKWDRLAALLAEDADLVSGDDDAANAQRVKILRQTAQIHVKERQAPADAVPLLERAAQLAPSDRELLLLLCDAYTASSRERDATQVLEKIIASFGGKRTKELSVYHHRLGRALARLGDRDVALTQFDLAFKIDPGSIEVLRDLGVLALESGDLDRAQKTFRALLLQKLDAAAGISKGEVFAYLGEVSMKQGDKPKAIQMLERAIENDPHLERARTMLSGLKG